MTDIYSTYVNSANGKSTGNKSTKSSPQPTADSWLIRLARQKFKETVAQLTAGDVEITDPMGSYRNLASNVQDQSLDTPIKPTLTSVTVNVLDLGFYQQLLTSGTNGAAASYIQGHWEVNDLTSLIRLMIRNRAILDKLDRKTPWISQKILQLWHLKNQNSLRGSKKNISAHYDLSNRFFELFLDKHMMYSSAIFADIESGGESLEMSEAKTNLPRVDLDSASEFKLKRICDLLALSPNDHLIEIGTGWGGFACYAAKHYGCRITTTTISDAQFQYATAQVESLGLSHLITVVNKDYRDLESGYDKLVSIEMVEAVGHQYLPTYFKTCAALLKPGGKALLQAITIEDHRYVGSLKEVDFIKKFVFPGSFIPSTSVLSSEAANHQLRLVHLDDFGQSYARTLSVWREKFLAKLELVEALGFNESFQRLWLFYLCYCEGGFLEASIGCQHLLFKKTHNN